MTISTQASQTILLGNGATTSFSFSFVGSAAPNIQVTYTDTGGDQIVLTPSQYTLILDPPPAGQLWGTGGTVIYPLSGSPIANGTSLTISRIVPLTQTVTIADQGDFSPQVIEQAMDLLEMQIQQVSARTGKIRGIWATNISYNYGDIVIDGLNGLDSGNYYTCVIANVSGTWTSDVAAGDWSLSIPSVLPIATLPLSIGNGGTGSTTAAAARTALGLGTLAIQDANNVSISGGAFVNANTFTPLGSSAPVNGVYAPSAGVAGVSADSQLALGVTNFTSGSGAPVNSIRISNARTTKNPIVEAVGSDANVSLDLCAQAAGGIYLRTNGPVNGLASVVQCVVDHAANAINPLHITGGASGSGPTISTAANNADINLSPNGSGGVVIGGSTGVSAAAISFTGSGTASPARGIYVISSTKYAFTNSGIAATIDSSLNFAVGGAAIATNATGGFLWIPSCPGAPTGAPTAPYTNAAALVADTTNSKLYVRIGSSWKSVTLS